MIETWTDKVKWPIPTTFVGIACDIHEFYTVYEQCACCYVEKLEESRCKTSPKIK
jgi:hypothetical protein